MESFGRVDGSQIKKTTPFGLIRRGNASNLEKMKPHFFRVMLDFMLQDAKIYIPTEFVERYGSRLGSHATLKVANGDTWEVELVTDDDGLIWLVKGCEDFTKHHFLKQGDILVFRLEQDSFFHVMVFEPTASEKKYRCKDVNSLGRLLNEVKVEEETDFGIGRKEVEGQGKLKQKKNKKGGGEGKGKEKLASPLKHVPTKVGRPNHPSKAEMRGIPEPRRDNASTSSENPNFFITINESHFKQRYMSLPVNFVFEQMMSGNDTSPEKRNEMVFGEEGFGPWVFSFFFQPRRGGGRGYGRFGAGWPAFCKDNSLKPGDVCRFELISDGQMKVSIQRT